MLGSNCEFASASEPLPQHLSTSWCVCVCVRVSVRPGRASGGGLFCALGLLIEGLTRSINCAKGANNTLDREGPEWELMGGPGRKGPEGRAPEGRAPEGRAPEGRVQEGRPPEGRGGEGKGGERREEKGREGEGRRGDGRRAGASNSPYSSLRRLTCF